MKLAKKLERKREQEKAKADALAATQARTAPKSNPFSVSPAIPPKNRGHEMNTNYRDRETDVSTGGPECVRIRRSDFR